MKRDEERARERQKVQVWSNYIRAGLAARKAYDRQAEETLAYFRAKHERCYSEAARNFIDFSSRGVCVSVNKPGMIRAVLGPHLYQRNPVRAVSAKSSDPIQQAQAAVLGAYLNYSPREAGLEEQVRKAVDDAMLRGRGFLRTGYDRERRVVTSWYVPSNRVVIDPAAECLDDAHWIAIRNRAPLWSVKRRFGGERWRVRDLSASRASQREPEETLAERPDDERVPGSYLADLVEYWEVYSKLGAGLARGPEAPGWRERGTAPAEDDGRDFVKLVIVRDHATPLYEGEWDCPLYLDKEWPVVALDLVPGIDQLWPESIFGQALSHAKAIDLTSTLRLWGCRTHARDIFLVHPDAFQGNEFNRLCGGGPSEVIELKGLPTGLGLNQVIHRVDMGDMSPEIAEERAWHEAEFERQTGVTSILHGGQETGAQERSATASDLRSRAANARLADMTARVESFCTRVARNEAIVVRLGDYLTEAEIAKTTGELQLGWLVSVQGPGEMPLRNRLTPAELRAREERGESAPLTVQDVAPAAAVYFPDEATAAQAAELVRVALIERALTGDPAALEYAFPAAELGLDFDVRPRAVTVEDVWRDTNGVSPRDLAGEFTWSIEAGTTQRQDPIAKREYATALTQNVLPVAVQRGDTRMMNEILRLTDEAFGRPSNERLSGFVELAPAETLPATAPAGPGLN